MNWQDFEEAQRNNFSLMQAKLSATCKECGAVISGADEKILKKKRRKHANLHLSNQLYIQSIMQKIGATELNGKLVEHIEKIQQTIALELYEKFRSYLRYTLDYHKIWDRLPKMQKGNLEYRVKQDWKYLSDEDKKFFNDIAKDFIDTIFPETKSDEESQEVLARVESN